ncbi:hypothetical protein Btru_043079 [Bulinus truncatus]|nr:hypothetical protein Btru_043079 [Bulinus truncatus]
MHPLVLRAFGINDPPKKSEDDLFPPNYNNMPSDSRKPAPPSDDIRKHIRQPGPHPGMRAAAEMQRQQAQQGSGRGMMGVVLPMYAIGIVLYLVYTLFKVFNKSKTNSWSKLGGQCGEREGSLDRLGFPANFDGSGDVGSYLQDQQQRKELEDLLSRVDDKNVSTEEMRTLQRRLEETEAQMTRILQAMHSVQTNVNRMTSTFPTCPEDNKDNPEEVISSEGGSEEVQGKESADSETEAGSAKAEAPVSDQDLSKVKEVDFDDIDKDSEEETEKQQEESDIKDIQLGDAENPESHVRQRRLNNKNKP